MSTTKTRLGPGQKAPAGSTVYLMHHSVEMAYFQADDEPGGFTAPPTANGFWYGYRTAEQVDTALAEYEGK